MDKEKESRFCDGVSKRVYALKELFFNKLLADNRVKEIFIER